MSRPRGERDLSSLSESKLLDTFRRVTLKLFEARSRNSPKADHYVERVVKLHDELERRGITDVAERLMDDSRFGARLRSAIATIV